MKKILVIALSLFLALPIFAFSGGPYVNYDLINDGTFFAKAFYGDTSLKTQNEIADNIRVHKFELGANLVWGDDKANGFDLSFRFKPHIGFSFLENQNGVGVRYTYYNNIYKDTYPKGMFAGNLGIEIGPDFSWHFNNISFGFYPYAGVSIEGGFTNFDVKFSTNSIIYKTPVHLDYVNFIGTFGIAPYAKLKKFTVSIPCGISINSGNITFTAKDINNKTIINNSYAFKYIDAFCKIEIGFLF